MPGGTAIGIEYVAAPISLTAKLPGVHSELRGKGLRVTAPPEKVHIFKDGVSLHYR